MECTPWVCPDLPMMMGTHAGQTIGVHLPIVNSSDPPVHSIVCPASSHHHQVIRPTSALHQLSSIFPSSSTHQTHQCTPSSVQHLPIIINSSDPPVHSIVCPASSHHHQLIRPTSALHRLSSIFPSSTHQTHQCTPSSVQHLPIIINSSDPPVHSIVCPASSHHQTHQTHQCTGGSDELIMMGTLDRPTSALHGSVQIFPSSSTHQTHQCTPSSVQSDPIINCWTDPPVHSIMS